VDSYKKHHPQVLIKLSMFKTPFKDDSDHQLWQEGFHPEEIQSEEMMKQKIEYIHNNPVRRGYIDEPERWCYSSARNYSGNKGLIDVYIEW
jgi:putative transposase